jgi:hypothetical protein
MAGVLLMSLVLKNEGLLICGRLPANQNSLLLCALCASEVKMLF